MEGVETAFSAMVEQRLKALNTNAFAEEKRANMPADAIRNVLRSQKKDGPSLSRAKEICDALGLELYFGPKRPELPPGFAEAEAEAVAMVKAATLNDGYMVLPWHADARRPGPTPIAFSRSWMQRLALEPDTLCLVAPDQVRLTGDQSPQGCVALIDTAAPRNPGPAPWAYLDRARVCLGEVLRHGPITVIRSGQRTEADLILQGPESTALRMLGRVLWWGTAEPAPPSDK